MLGDFLLSSLIPDLLLSPLVLLYRRSGAKLISHELKVCFNFIESITLHQYSIHIESF